MIEIILLEPEHEGNVGAVCRAMANFGFSKLIVVNPQCDLENDEFYRRMKHAKGKVLVKVVKKIPKYDILVGTTAKINTDYNLERSPILAEQLAGKVFGVKGKVKVGLLFGREGIGLTNEEIGKCNLICTINSSKRYSTLNLSHAVTIILYELHKNMKTSKIADKIKPVDEKDGKRLISMMDKVIGAVGYKNEKNETQKKIWRNVFKKSVLTRREAYGMMGLLSKIGYRIKNNKNDKVKVKKVKKIKK